MKRIACLPLLVILLLYSWYFINLWKLYIWWILILFLYASNILSQKSLLIVHLFVLFFAAQKLQIFTWYDLLIFFIVASEFKT